MTKYAEINSDGIPTAFYAPDVHGGRTRPIYGERQPIFGDRPIIGAGEDGETPVLGEPAIIGYEPPPVIGEEPNPDCRIPAEAVEISDEQWMEFLNHQGQRQWVDGAVIPYTPPVPPATADDVNAERQSRIVVGRVINGVRVTGRDTDARNLMSLALIAQMRIAAGDTTTPTTFRDGDNVDHALTPPQILTMWQESAAFVSAIYQASWDIKAMDPIPADYAADHYWP
jgi:hypothetical protein